MQEMISVQEARSAVLSKAATTAAEDIELPQAIGRVLREPIVARENIPPFDNSAMDGFAVRSADFASLPTELRIIDDIPAGSVSDVKLTPGSCARIMTGAPVPEGADSVVPVEWCTDHGEVGGTVLVEQAPSPHQHVRNAGDDVKVGQVVIESGNRITTQMMGTLASLGYDRVSVSAKPSVSVVATGDELVPVGASLRPGQIRNSNGPALTTLSLAAGTAVNASFTAPDDFDETLAVLEEACTSSILIVSGGVSVGSYDFVKEALDRLGIQMLFWRVRQKPGKPLAFGTIGTTLVFGLPGNPVSSTVCFYQYVYPAIAATLGMSTDAKIHRAVLKEPVIKKGGLHYFVAGRTSVDSDGHLCVVPSGPQGSHVYSSIAAADCLIHLDEEMSRSPEPGSIVNIELFPC